ncbi:MAG: ATP phosphoribosyltransferase regulatory subunit [Pseudomonadota bacterium]
MAAETIREFEALEAQAQKLLSGFIAGGHEAVAPALIQPANVYLDVIGETLRARTYVFQDPNGVELCLRPDLTVPTCLLHLERPSNGETTTKYCYNGTAFRFQPSDADAAHPREFRQLGIETFGGDDREKVEAETVALILEGLKEAGLTDFGLRIGDLGILQSVMDGADMPQRWRQKLMHQFWRPDAFRAELERLTNRPSAAADALDPELRKLVEGAAPGEVPGILSRYLEAEGIELIGSRALVDIAESLVLILEDAKAEPLAPATAELIANYVGVNARAKAAGARLKDLMRDQEINISDALDTYQRRLALLADAGVDVSKANFSAQFGRSLEYYTGFVFEVVAPTLGDQSPVAGGGRYDTVLRACGAKEATPAAGAAIHTERLLAAVVGGQALNGEAS